MRSRFAIRTTALALLVAFAVASAGVCVASEEVIWETGYLRVHFDWNGYWDRTAWWAYGMWVVNIYDWAYLFAWYGLAWDNLTSISGPPPTQKVDLYLCNDPSDSFAIRPDEEYLKIWVNLAGRGDLILDSPYNENLWVEQVCSLGGLLSFGLSLNMFSTYTGLGLHGYELPKEIWYLRGSLAEYTHYVLWPWSYEQYGQWYSSYSHQDIETNYKYYVQNDGGLLSLLGAASVVWQAVPGGTNAYYMQFALADFLAHLDSQGVQNNGYLLNGFKAGHTLSESFYGKWGLTLDPNANDPTNTSDYYYWFYHYWWG